MRILHILRRTEALPDRPRVRGVFGFWVALVVCVMFSTMAFRPSPVQQQPTPAVPGGATVELTLPQAPVQAVVNQSLAQDGSITRAFFAGLWQRARIAGAQRALREELALYGAVVIGQTVEQRNTLTVQVPPEQVPALQRLAGVHVSRVINPVPVVITQAAPLAITQQRPVRQPGYPVVTVERR